MDKPASQAQQPAPVHVLVVDDEEGIRQLFRTGLTHFGCAVETAANGQEGLQTLMQQSFDVLVVDLKMQQMDGVVFVQEALKIWPWLGVVIVSGFVSTDVVPQLSRLGVTRILEKPIGVQQLYDHVMAEAEARRNERPEAPRGNALALMRDHLKLLTHLRDRAMSNETLVGALLEFGMALARMLTSSVVGILVLDSDGDNEERTLLLAAQSRVSPTFLERLKADVFARYQALSGKEIDPGQIQVQIEGEPCDPLGPEAIGSTLSVPVILGHQVHGLLTLASVGQNVYTPSDVSLLYHAANHVSAVFTALRKMHHLATRDPLTGVYNRIRLEEELESSWQLGRRYDLPMSVAVLDIDNFKTLNDSYGHTVGDQVLRDFAQLMLSVARSSDVIARYGGDEFVAILPRAEEADARAFGARFVRSLRNHDFCRNTHRLRLTVSVGIASSRGSSAPGTSAELLTQADRALFMAKRAGRDRVCLWPGQSIFTVDDRAAITPAPALQNGPSLSRELGRKDRIIVVDDDASVRDLIRLMLEKQGYDVTAFPVAAEAIDAVKLNPRHYDVVLTDLALPGKTGLDVLREVGQIDESIVKIVITGFATVDSAVNCLREGAYDFIQKPVRQSELLALIRRSLEYRYLKLDNARYQVHLEDMVRKRSSQLAASLEEIKKAHEFTLQALVAMLDAREHQTGAHSTRARDMAVSLARAMGLDGDLVEAVASGAFLHDIGKIAIPDAILLKPSALTPEEWERMQSHSEIGYRILCSSPYLREAAEIVYSHHEHFDGTGYPRGLKADQICIGAKIFAVVDAYDTIRSGRVYREPAAAEAAMEEIRRGSGRQFDPEVVKAFMQYHAEFERVRERTQT